MKEKIKKYLPDGLILSGVMIFSYNLLRPATYFSSNRFNGLSGPTNYHTNAKVFGLFLLTIGIILAVRRYSVLKNK